MEYSCHIAKWDGDTAVTIEIYLEGKRILIWFDDTVEESGWVIVSKDSESDGWGDLSEKQLPELKKRLELLCQGGKVGGLRLSVE